MIADNFKLFVEMYSQDPVTFHSKINEELLELGLAFLHMKDNKVTTQQLAKEIADALIQIEKICFLYSDAMQLAKYEYMKQIRELEKRFLHDKFSNTTTHKEACNNE
jgi:NTP pyrophosphatase (non-canonical NTP hydrolase)